MPHAYDGQGFIPGAAAMPVYAYDGYAPPSTGVPMIPPTAPVPTAPQRVSPTPFDRTVMPPKRLTVTRYDNSSSNREHSMPPAIRQHAPMFPPYYRGGMPSAEGGRVAFY